MQLGSRGRAVIDLDGDGDDDVDGGGSDDDRDVDASVNGDTVCGHRVSVMCTSTLLTCVVQLNVRVPRIVDVS